MTLIEVRNSDGVIGRCNELCYNAQHPECNCVCHGKNHGVGLRQAIDNIRELAGALTTEYRGGGQAVELADRELGQIPLFQE